MIYRGEMTGQISFPLGGIGSGCIGLAGNGRLIDWEIYNRANKGTLNGMSHFRRQSGKRRQSNRHAYPARRPATALYRQLHGNIALSELQFSRPPRQLKYRNEIPDFHTGPNSRPVLINSMLLQVEDSIAAY